jgi:PAS domain S-box-containing protein
MGRTPGGVESQSGRRVLLIDDEVDFAESLRDILESRGYLVDAVHAANLACERTLSFEPQVALVDIRLGRASGIDLLSALRRARPEMLCVMMTAYADVETAIQALAEGAYHYLRKPIEARDLLATIERCFERIRLEEEKVTAEAALRARNEELAEINARLRQMVESARELAACSRLGDLGHRLLDEFARIMAAQGGSIFFRGQRGFECVCSLDKDHVPSWLEALPSDATVFGRALRERRPVVIRDISAEPGLKPSGWGGYKDGSLVVFPIEIDGEVRALLSLHNKRWPPFTEQDRELGQVLISLSGEILRVQQAAEAVRTSEERYRLLAENVTDVIWTTDAKRSLVYVSPSVERETGYTPDEVIAMGLERLLAPSSVSAALEALEGEETRGPGSGEDERRARTVDLEIVRRDRTTLWAEVTITSLPASQGGGLLGVARNITARRQAEEQLARLGTRVAQTEKMEAIGRLAGGIAHDFNNILSAILGFADLAERSHCEPVDLPRYLQGIREAGNRAADLTRQILTFSRQAPQETRPVDVRGVVDEALKLMRAALPSTIEIRRKLVANAAVMADPTQIHQVVVNLCTNAGLAMRDGGVLELGLDDVDLDASFAEVHAGVEPGRFVHLSVRDTGCGMSPEMLAHIFEPFYTTRAKGEGTGMGLAVVHGIVRNHGGLIAVDSEPGSGSTFHIYLPAISAPAAEDAAPSRDLPRGRAERILFVDDEEIQVQLAQELLEDLGYAVTGVRSAVEALDLFRARPDAFDIVVTDTTMPGMTGDVLAAGLLRIQPRLPVLMCTGFSERVSDAQVRAIGVRELLMKPFSLEDLASAIRRALDARPDPS